MHTTLIPQLEVYSVLTLRPPSCLPFATVCPQGTNKEEAAGIKLSGLLKMSNTKSANGKTFLRFVVETVLERAPELLLCADEFALVHKNKNLAMDVVQADCRKLQSGLKRLDAVIKAKPYVCAPPQGHA